ERVLDRYVYRTRINYQRTVRYASSKLTRSLQLSSVIRFVQDLVMTSAGSEAVAVYLKTDRELNRAHEEPKESSGRFKAPERLPAHVLEYLEAINDHIVTDEIANHRFNRFGAVYDHLINLDWALVLPVMFEESVIGAIAVGPKRSGDPFYPHDLDLL